MLSIQSRHKYFPFWLSVERRAFEHEETAKRSKFPLQSFHSFIMSVIEQDILQVHKTLKPAVFSFRTVPEKNEIIVKT
ncbi:hypothetical protein CEQ83_09480 [Priestia megaterium]|nr:hypothetical protein CEQ83_09480 [Priestia megaterium]